MRYYTHIAALAFCVTILPQARGQVLSQDFKFIAIDGEQSDNFGTSVSASGTVAIVGAPYESDQGNRSGAAYVFDLATGQQVLKLLASDGSSSDQFGTSVSVSGSVAIVGAVSNGDPVRDAGAAYVFDVSTGQELWKLTASDAAEDDRFGHAVAIDGPFMVVGAPLDDDAGLNSGSAYVFDVTSGQQLFKLTASDASEEDWFGTSVSVSGTLAMIGAPFDGDGAAIYSGSVYVFDLTTGEELFKLNANDASIYDEFGRSVAARGNIGVIGAWTDGVFAPWSGSAYVFDLTTGQQLRKLIPSDGKEGARFGVSVALSDTRVTVGAYRDPSNGTNSGTGYVFDVQSGQQLFKLTATDTTPNHWFGISVAATGTLSVIGAIGDTHAGTHSGAAYAFSVAVVDCPADVNGDGLLSPADFSAWIAAFNSLAPECDQNGDGGCTPSDFSAWIANYNSGC